MRSFLLLNNLLILLSHLLPSVVPREQANHGKFLFVYREGQIRQAASSIDKQVVRTAFGELLQVELTNSSLISFKLLTLPPSLFLRR